jgi:hypothetical protein
MYSSVLLRSISRRVAGEAVWRQPCRTNSGWLGRLGFGPRMAMSCARREYVNPSKHTGSLFFTLPWLRKRAESL